MKKDEFINLINRLDNSYDHFEMLLISDEINRLYDNHKMEIIKNCGNDDENK